MTRVLVAHSGSLCLCHSSSFQLTLAPSDSPSSSLRRSAHKVLARLFLKLMAQEEDASEEMILQGDLKRQRNLFLTPDPDLTLPHRGVCDSFSGPHLNLYKCIPPFIISGYFHQEQKTRPSLKRPHAFWPHNGEQGTWAHADEAAAEKAECLCIVSYNCDLRGGLTAHSGKDTCARRRLVLKKHFLMWWINSIVWTFQILIIRIMQY